jgi:DNA-binding NarL/FixJ family response regulator
VAALRLAEEATALRKTVHVQASPTELRRLEQCVASARAELGEAVSQAILAEVRMIPVEQIIAEGLSTTANTPATSTEVRSSREAATPLTQRELEVVALVAKGRTNLQIAEKLVLSIRTVESHVRNAMAKLHLISRVSLATWAVERRSSQ